VRPTSNEILCRNLSPAVPPRSGQSRRDGRHAPARHQSEATPSPRRHRASSEPRSAPDDSRSFLADSISAPILIRVRREPVCSSPRDSWARFSGSYREDDNFSSKVGSAVRNLGAITARRQCSRPPASPSSSRCVAGVHVRFPDLCWVVALRMPVAAGTGLADGGVDLIGSISPGLPSSSSRSDDGEWPAARGSGCCPDGIRRVDGGCGGFHGQRRTGRLTPRRT
jgi:hypothetical protein